MQLTRKEFIGGSVSLSKRWQDEVIARHRLR